MFHHHKRFAVMILFFFSLWMDSPSYACGCAGEDVKAIKLTTLFSYGVLISVFLATLLLLFKVWQNKSEDLS
jgi:hypothetical protein